MILKNIKLEKILSLARGILMKLNLFSDSNHPKTSYWIELLKQSQKSNAKTSKIISFSPSESDNYETSDFDEIIQDQINIIQLPREDLASLAAGNTVIQESDDEGKIFSQIAPELDAIWKKITKTA